MVDSAYILAPQVVRVQFEVAPAYSAFESLRELVEVNRLSGLGNWVTQTAATLPPERAQESLSVEVDAGTCDECGRHHILLHGAVTGSCFLPASGIAGPSPGMSRPGNRAFQ